MAVLILYREKEKRQKRLIIVDELNAIENILF